MTRDICNLEHNWRDAINLVGEARARIWRLYMAGSAVAFERNRIGVNQLLAVNRTNSPQQHPLEGWTEAG